MSGGAVLGCIQGVECRDVGLSVKLVCMVLKFSVLGIVYVRKKQ